MDSPPTYPDSHATMLTGDTAKFVIRFRRKERGRAALSICPELAFFAGVSVVAVIRMILPALGGGPRGPW